MTDNIEEFWPIFLQKFLSQLTEADRPILVEILNRLDQVNRELELMKILKNPDLVNNTLKLISNSSRERQSALSYFYNMQLDNKTIGDFFYGILNLALQLDILVVIAFDELQFLDEIDESNKLLKLFLEKFIRHLMEQFQNQRLYIAISCLENPKDEEWTRLKTQSKSFASIVANKEIILGNLMVNEKNEIIEQVADKIGFDRSNQKIFYSKIKESLLYFLPRDLLKQIAYVLDTMDYMGYTEYEIRTIYEENAREFMEEKLRKKGFKHLLPEVKNVGGYNIDIYATGATNRSGYIPKAFGEVTISGRSKMKQKVEKFSNWLFRMRGREYNPEKNDYAFFVCPPNSITEGTQKVLKDNIIELFYFNSPIVEQIQRQRNKDVPEVKEKPSDIMGLIDIKKGKKSEVGLIFVKEEKYKLEHIPGIGPAFAEKLRKGKIFTVKDLLNCNVKMKSKEIKGIGEARLNTWKQNARQILED